MRIGLTGGIGSGKSTVAELLADHGMVVVDADRVARQVVEPGRATLRRIAERFGDDVVRADGTLDRAGLAAIVFNDDQARTDLEAITHPAIHDEIVRLECEARRDDSDAIVVVDHPLLVETGQTDTFDAVVVVLADRSTRLARLAGHRGVDRDDALARMASQADDDARRAAATWVIDNNDSMPALRTQVEEVVSTIRQRARDVNAGRNTRDT